jgi:ATP-binding cassette, subfamily B, multidrug efflux pump
MWMDNDNFDDEEQQGRLPTLDMFRRIYPYIRPHRMAFVAAFFLGLVAVAASLAQPLVLARIIDVDVPAGDIGGLFRSALIYLGLMLGMGLATISSTILLGKAGVMAVNAIKRTLFGHFFRLGVLWLEKLPVGVLVSRIESDSQRLISLTSTMMMQILSAMGILLGALVILARKDMRLFYIAVAVIPVMIVGTLLVFWSMRTRFRKERSLYGKLTGLVAEVAPAARFLQAVGRTGWARRRIEKENQRYNVFSVKLFFMEYGFLHSLGFLEVVMTVTALWLGSRWVSEGTMTVGVLVAFAQLVAMVYWPIIALSEQLAEIQRAGAAADRIFEVLDRQPPVAAPADPAPVPKSPGSIRFDHVTFEYEPGKPVLRDVSLTINAGETMALVGPTGGGKSTIIGLVCRFMDPTKGRIILDGRDLREYDPRQLRRMFGLVLQDLYLFPTTIEDNLRAFRQDISPEQVEAAASTAGLHHIIRGKAKGYKTVLGSRGRDLSYGQRQLMAFARALTVDPPVLVLDEATSSVDPGTELKIQEALTRLTTGRTTIVVAHRLTTVRGADKILVIDDGKITESGTHGELLALGGTYARLARLQMGEVSDAV